jgi:hypothetical protein
MMMMTTMMMMMMMMILILMLMILQARQASILNWDSPIMALPRAVHQRLSMRRENPRTLQQDNLDFDTPALELTDLAPAKPPVQPPPPKGIGG